MAIKYGKKKQRHNNVLYTIITAVLICTLFLSVVSYLYSAAEDEAYEMLHIQTKQIKDDLTLQIKSDRENLVTMANFAAKLYSDGESYDLMFDSFKPIGLFSNIGILNPDNTFVTRVGSINLDGKISFDDEAARGSYISGRIPDLTRDGKEIIRSAVPIVLNGRTIGILYGVIHLETIGEKYNKMAQELDAQFFVYDKETGKFVIDTIDKNPGELSQLKNRKYNPGYSYDQFITTDKGFSSFKSIFTGENLYVHYSTLEDFNWGIMLARYESQVFANTHNISKVMISSFGLMVLIVAIYLIFVLRVERRRSAVTAYSSEIRKLLLEINQQQTNVYEALRRIQETSLSGSAFFVDTDREEYHYVLPEDESEIVFKTEKQYFIGELFKYAAKLHEINHASLGFIHITPNNHLIKTNARLYEFVKEHNIEDIAFATIVNQNNHVSILGVLNAKNTVVSRALLEDVAVCFSIAIYNKKHLNRTETAATTDSLTGVMNRVSYKKDILMFDAERPEMFSCIYVDVNELHMLNNKYGHAAGDEMLIFIANTLKEAFYGHYVYRMGGDEFLVFTKGVKPGQIKDQIANFIEQLNTKQYKVAIGTSFRQQNTNCEEMVREAEIRMYEAKAQYYQNKDATSVAHNDDQNYIHTTTGIREIDTMISVLKEHYNGIYRVSLETDNAHRILMPAYLGYNENEESFSRLFKKYIEDIVHPDYHRAVLNFLNYDAIIRQLSEGNIPKINYKKANGETVVLSVYKLNDTTKTIKETLWVFAKS